MTTACRRPPTPPARSGRVRRAGPPPSLPEPRPLLEGPTVKNRISIRGIAVATGVVMASSVVGAAAAGAELPIGDTSVTRIGPLPSDASITRTAKPAGELRQEIKAKHRR